MKKNVLWIILLFGGVSLIYFYQIFLGKIPFPGDLLIDQYSPWKYTSFLGFAPGGYPQKYQYFDVLNQMYPWTTFGIRSFQLFEFPLWNPYNFSGTPLFANGQSAYLYPLHVLYFLFPQVIAWTILIILQPFLASIFTYLYAQKIGIGRWGSLFSAISFGYCLFNSVFLEYNTIGQVILFLPIILFLIELVLERKTFVRLFLLPLCIGIASFAGHIQLFGFVIVFSLFYSIGKSLLQSNNKRKNIGIFLLLFVLGCGISSIQLFPTLELILNAARSNQEYTFLIKKLLLQPSQLLLFFSPDLFGNPATNNYLLSDSYPGNAIYIGLLPFLYALYAVMQLRKNTNILFYTISSIVLIILFLNSPLTQELYKIQVPFISTGSPTNAIFLLSFSLSILAGFGLHTFLDKKDKKFISIFVVSIFVFGCGIFTMHVMHIAYTMRNSIYTGIIYFLGALVVFLLYFFVKKQKIIVVLLLLLTIFDLMYFFEKFNPFVRASLMYPPTPIATFLKTHGENFRFWSYGNAFIQPNIATQFELYDVNGYDPLYSKNYGIFINSVKKGEIDTNFSDINRSDALFPSVFTAKDLLQNPNEIKVLNLLGVKYIVTKDDPTTYLLPLSQFSLVYNKDGWQIFRNNAVLPRAFVVYAAKSYNTNRDFTNQFYSQSFDAHSTILLHNIRKDGIGKGSATITNYQPTNIVISTTSTKKGLLFLSDTYFPGWYGYVDGKQEPILQADYTFRAIQIPSGIHTVRFVYKPVSFSVGAILSILSLALTVIFLCTVPKKLYA